MTSRRIALCHEWVTTYGGSEQVAARIARALGVREAFTFTAEAGMASRVFGDLPVRLAHPLGGRRFVRTHWRWFLPLMPWAWSRLDLSDYDAVITSSHACTNAIRPPEDVVHISYCYTPMRYAWEWQMELRRLPAPLRPVWAPVAGVFRAADRRWSERVDLFIAISRHVAERIDRYYGKQASVIYPPIDTSYWIPSSEQGRGDHFLLAGRLVAYKRPEIAVEAANLTGLPLIVAGGGPELANLRRLAGPTVEFVEDPSTDQLRDLYRSARAFVFPGVEDFGLTMVEAQACGTPVIALGRGGALEAVEDGRTGVLYDNATPKGLAEAMTGFDPDSYRVEDLREHVVRFDVATFDGAIRDAVDTAVGTSTS